LFHFIFIDIKHLKKRNVNSQTNITPNGPPSFIWDYSQALSCRFERLTQLKPEKANPCGWLFALTYDTVHRNTAK
jgi:hypothetical protein